MEVTDVQTVEIGQSERGPNRGRAPLERCLKCSRALALLDGVYRCPAHSCLSVSTEASG